MSIPGRGEVTVHSCWRLTSCLLLQALLPGQAPEVLSSTLDGPAVFDPVRGRLVCPLRNRTTWEWDGVWFRSIANAPDMGTSFYDMVFDPRSGKVLLCMTHTAGGRLFAYDGAQWTPLPLPPGQWPLHLVHDPARARLVLLTVDSNQTLTSTFEDSGAGWVAVNTPTRVPYSWPAPQDAATYDPLTGRTMLVTGGGTNGSAAIWWYNGANWSLQTSATPPQQQGCALAFDPTRGVVVMHGGMVGFFQFPADVWEWNGTTWTNRGPGTTALQALNTSLTFDSVRGRLLGLGRMFGATYVAQWDGTAWTVLDQLPLLPAMLRLAHDPLRNVTVGVSTTQTIEWRDGRWAAGAQQQPPIETAFFDIVRGTVVGVSLAQLPGAWTWNGANWSPLPPSAALPPPRLDYALAFDSLLGRATLFGGSTNAAVFGDTWVWNGATWTQLQPPTSPPARYRAHMVQEVASGRSVLAGGKATLSTTAVPLTDAWSFDGTTWQQVSAGQAWMASGQVDLVHDDNHNRVLAVSNNNGLFEVRALVAGVWQLQSSSPGADVGYATFESQRGTILISTWDLSRVPVHASGVATSGAGCGRPLQLSARTWPRAGEPNFGFDLRGVGGAALVAVSLGTANTPLGGGCTALLQSLDLTLLTVANAAGFGQALVPIPDLPIFRGLSVHAQAAQLDATSPIGIGLSARLDLVVGD
jgi:hypothetical protein